MTAGDYEEFLKRYSLCQRRVWAFLHTMLPHDGDADDVLQETSLVLWSNWHRFDQDRDFAGWAIGVARLQALKFLRENSSKRAMLDEGAIVKVAEEAHKQMLNEEALGGRRDAFKICLQKLDAKLRGLVEQRYSGALSVKEIAVTNGVPVQTIYSGLARARQRLSSCVKRRIVAAERGGS